MASRPPDAPVIWSSTETAGFLRISRWTLYSWVARGYGPPAHKHAGRLMFFRDEVIAWARAHGREPS